MKFINKNKFTLLAIIIFVAVCYVIYFAFSDLFYNSSKPKYGDRLDGIEKVEIKDKDLVNLEKKIKGISNVKDVDASVSGRTLNIIITVDNKVEIDDAKKIGTDSYASLKEDQVKYYAIQVFIKKEDESKKNFPIIGYKQKETTKMIWTKNR